jgi:hypothetical protein
MITKPLGRKWAGSCRKLVDYKKYFKRPPPEEPLIIFPLQ